MSAQDELDKTLRSLAAFKAHFTRIEGANERLVEYAPAVASSHTLGEITKGLDRLEKQYDKLSDCADKVVELTDNEDTLKDLRRYLDKANECYEKNRSALLDMIKQIDVPLREPATVAGRAAGGAGGGAPGKLNVNKSLKPFTLLTTHNPSEFVNWCRQFKAYYRSSNMEVLEYPDQQIYLQSCIEPKLFARIYNKLEDTMTMFGDAGSCIAELLKDFDEQWPLFNRRLSYFRSEQAQGQEVSAWMNELDQLSENADISLLRTEDIQIFRILCGITNAKIRHKLTKIKDPTIKLYREKVTELEVSRQMETSLDSR